MFTKCPACASSNVRRSLLRGLEVSAKPRLRSPYRCRDCGERFWVVSRRANYLASLAIFAIVAGIVAWNVVGAPEQPRRDPGVDAGSLAETFARAARDDPIAEYKVSQIYARGTGIAGNKKEAQAWLERSAQHGNPEAQYELGNALREGLGVVQDYERAVKWLQLAAASGSGDAQYALGQMHRAGMGVPADNVKAYMWFNLATAQDIAGAAAQRDSVLRILSPDQVLEAQVEARRLSQSPDKQSAVAR
jgi:hypothetical protein